MKKQTAARRVITLLTMQQQGSFGCFKLTTNLVNELDPMDERQRICLEPIYDPARSVWFDPDAKKYDKSDAGWAFYLYSRSVDRYKAKYNKDPAT